MKRCWTDWLKKAGIRALKTVAQTAVATIGTTAVMNEVDWIMVGSASLLAGVPSDFSGRNPGRVSGRW